MRTTSTFARLKRIEERQKKNSRSISSSMKNRNPRNVKLINKRIMILKKKLNLFNQNAKKKQEDDLYKDPFRAYKKLLLTKDKWVSHGRRLGTTTRYKKKPKSERNGDENGDYESIEQDINARNDRKSILRRNKTVGNFKLRANNTPYFLNVCTSDPMNKTFSFKKTTKFNLSRSQKKEKKQLPNLKNMSLMSTKARNDTPQTPPAERQMRIANKHPYTEERRENSLKARHQRGRRSKVRSLEINKILFKMYNTFDSSIVYATTTNENSKISRSVDFSKRLDM